MRRLLILMLTAMIGLVFLIAMMPPVRSRIALVPLFVRTQINALRPTAVLPTPLPLSAVSPAELLTTATVTPSPSQTPIASVSATPLPITATPSPTATPTATPFPLTPPAPAITLTGFTHAWQTWNNCGPTTISMSMSYYGFTGDQAQAARLLKPNADDKNVSPDELAAYAAEHGFSALIRVNGHIALLQRLLSNGFPVLVETWLDPEDRGGLGHYRLLTGYDQAGGFFTAQDSLLGPDVPVAMAEFDELWRVFNRTYLIVYQPQDAMRLQAILGADADDDQMLNSALETAQAEARSEAHDPYAWFNMGSTYVALGEPELAAAAFDEARRIGLPYRMLWYQFGPFAAYLATGRYQEVHDLATATIAATGGLEEAYFYRGLALRGLGDENGAQIDFAAALDYNPNFAPAETALHTEPVEESTPAAP